MAIYQFLVAIRSSDTGGGSSAQLMNEAGEVTSHLQGMWYRTLKFIEAGIKPCVRPHARARSSPMRERTRLSAALMAPTPTLLSPPLRPLPALRAQRVRL